ncbi:hypothetical protein Mro03_70800 [Microbispora rosea subsp. rosea]|nr:hypothetical protein Mro03_70800 [Microbispora rosea subsp. rosea]
MSSGQEKDRLEQMMNASDMRETSYVIRAQRSGPARGQGSGDDREGHIGGGHTRLPGPVNLRYHPEMSSSPATSGLLAWNHERPTP